ncbi:DUF1405 domain-containing protein [Halorubrum ezzemoulense]|uniref:DUF1405 domain-containing protein n=1 Tax=Halorubrum ezzemoulense TaxID=337243 RepID=A0A256JP77_HALEZ|nr:DUF1405 domain-containing protein [Halorubrum ezzemoulense]MDB2245438.1 DUF1405 domain-containing protein [Halorubrum ezzemoulense]MDB2250324.1 DUF1405 domain-containing protein [Halorubrum ezzemoulense]MDB2279184.1 DUF1405 domain-containing protein [Halorubrum ezzemoulense]MDB2285580.1 DUF1405 domain-containing protein [Halorubrum ezzemoulense]MDB2287394.1 DUF1405 domain-containing protein [Halorubrum ezzemoulense]
MSRSDRFPRLRRLRQRAVRRRVRAAIAEELLGTPRSLAVVCAFTAFMFAVGVGYYAPTADEVPVVLWPLYADSAVAVALGGGVLASVVPAVRRGGSVTADAPTSRGLAYLHTVAFVWLVQFGLWPLVSLNLAVGQYVSAPDALIYYWGVIGTHLLFVGLALLFPAFGRTTRGALATALGLGVANAVVDYGLGYHPPLLYEPGPGLTAATLAIAVGAVTLAARSFCRVGKGPA